MRWSWKIGEVAGIGVYVHATFWLLIFFILFANWTHGHNLATALYGVIFVLVIFVCITLHELGHALAALRFGVRTRDITLLPIGGLARLDQMPENPIHELWVALAGPAVNVLIAALLYLVLLGAGRGLNFEQFRWFGGNFLNKLMIVNIWLVAFNMIPAFPMDGGRVLRALLATRMEFSRATRVAARVGQGIAVIFAVAGLFTDPILVFIALFVWTGARQESAMPNIHSSFKGVPVHRVMLTDFRRLAPDDLLGQVVEPILAERQQDFPVVFGDHVLGVVTREALTQTLAERGPGARVRDAMRRDVPTADAQESLEQALALFREGNCRSVPVEHEGRLVGLLTLENIREFLAIQSALHESSLRIREENSDNPVNSPSDTTI
ncbi:MAG: site-2 protease family protein [Acidobacteria bacterium]|nr:site-2 protease family protein [Acidobacteriota bacterium]